METISLLTNKAAEKTQYTSKAFVQCVLHNTISVKDRDSCGDSFRGPAQVRLLEHHLQSGGAQVHHVPFTAGCPFQSLPFTPLMHTLVPAAHLAPAKLYISHYSVTQPFEASAGLMV